VAIAQLGRQFADDAAALCDTLAGTQQSPEQVDELLSKLIATAEKAYGRSIQAQGQLICVRLGLSQVGNTVINYPIHNAYMSIDIREPPITSVQDSRRRKFENTGGESVYVLQRDRHLLRLDDTRGDHGKRRR
jgi:hypothetical protein